MDQSAGTKLTDQEAQIFSGGNRQSASYATGLETPATAIGEAIRGELNDSSRDQILQPNYLGASEDNSSELEGLTVQSNNIEVYEHNPNQFAIDSYFNLNGANNLSSGQFGAPEAQRNQFVVSIIYSNQSQDYQYQDLIVQNHSNQEPIVQNFQHPNSIAQIYQNHDPNIQNNQQNNFYAQNDQNQDPCAHNQPQYYPNSLENETFYSNPPYSNSIQYENQVMPPRNDSGYSDHATPEFYEPAIQPADQFQGEFNADFVTVTPHHQF